MIYIRPLNFLKILAVSGILFFPHIGKAQDAVSARIQSKEINYRLLAGPQFSTMSLSNGTLSGAGIAVGGSFLFGEKWAATLLFSQSYDQGGLKALHSGVLPGISYTLLGSRHQKHNSIDVDGRTMISMVEEKSWNMSVGAGFDQYWLNGSQSVYSASGFAAFLSGEVPVSDWFWIQPELRVSSLSTGAQENFMATSIQIFLQFKL